MFSLNARLDHNIEPGERFFISYARDALNQPNGVNPPSLPILEGRALRPVRHGGRRTDFHAAPQSGERTARRCHPHHHRLSARLDALRQAVLPSIGGQPYVLGSGLVTNPYSPASSSDPQARLAPLYQASEKVSWLKGIHNIKAGFDVRFVSVHEYLSFNVMPRVILGTGNVATQISAPSTASAATARLPTACWPRFQARWPPLRRCSTRPPHSIRSSRPGPTNSRTYRQRELAAFIQDDLRLRRNLT